MSDFIFGTAGVPVTTGSSDTVAGIAEVARLGLDALEMEWVHGVKVKPDKCDEIRAIATENKVSLSVHAPYYINLAAKDPLIIEASIGRIINSAVLAERAGATGVVFHPAFMMGRDREIVEKEVFSSYSEVISQYEKRKLKITLRPELTGKDAAYGRLDEVIKISREFPHTLPCIDWSHLHARTGGEYNSYKEWCAALEALADGLGEDSGIRNMHVHLSGIRYTQKGERDHTPIEESDLNWRELFRAMKAYGCGGLLICESPHKIQHEDALLFKKTYAKVKPGKK